MQPEAEKDLVQRARNDSSAFGELYEMYYSRIFGYALRRTANFQTAQDVTSEVFFKGLKGIRKFHWREAAFSSWLYGIASNEIADGYQRNGREAKYLETMRVPPFSAEIASAKAELERHDDYLALQQAISRLPPRYQEPIALKYFEDKKIREIADIMGRPEGTVKSLLHRGLARLAALLGDDPGEDRDEH
jgi:RNA polymerase sigma-70 factor (ECF subfamily)